MAEGARRDLSEGLGPEFQDFDIADLNPRTFVRKHLIDDFEPDPVVADPDPVVPEPDLQPQAASALAPGGTPPYDSEPTCGRPRGGRYPGARPSAAPAH